MEAWELQNDITTILDPNSHNDTSLVQMSGGEQPWINDPSYFKKAMISDLSLLKMATHVNSGRDKGVIGLLRGRIDGDTFIVVDAFPLHVEADNTDSDKPRELLKYYNRLAQDGGLENVVGWYRAHTISGVFFCAPDISAHEQIQQLKEPSLALIIDPATTFPVGKVGIGAFRTYPEGYTPPDKPVPKNRRTDLPPKLLETIRHMDKSCQLDVTYFKSLVDTNLLKDLWNSYCACGDSSISGLKSIDQKVSALGPAGGFERPCLKSVDQNVAVVGPASGIERFSGLHAEKKKSRPTLVYFIIVKYGVGKNYESSSGDYSRSKELFTELMEEAGSSGDQITTYATLFFFARLTEEQAKKLSNSDRVKQIRPSY